MSNEIGYQGTYLNETDEVKILNKSSVYENYDLSSNSSINIPKETDASSQKLLISEFDGFPEFNIPVILKNAPKIFFNKDTKEEMFENASFRRYISEIENRLFLFKKEYRLVFNAEIYFQQDWEIEDLRNIILLIKFYNVPFENELKLWKKLSIYVREGLQLSKDFISSKEYVIELKKYNKDFYIKLDLT
ncbi:hypothetical protein LCGC14_1533530 [marine sediment metagenome]|uniref:Uncharacterized protein n=1 Tax=marine sediment metagenome TaxID=412755 RepID=A0A0F9IV88_9ZZZZ